MDKVISDAVRTVMGKGEKMAPVKSVKLKVKFDKGAKTKALKGKVGQEIHRRRVGNDMLNK